MVQHKPFVLKNEAGSDNFADRCEDSSIGKIPGGIIIAAYEKHPVMVSACDFQHVVQIFKVLMVSRQQNAIIPNGMSQMHRIRPSHQATIRRRLYIVARSSEKFDQQLGDRVVIKVYSH